MTEFLNPYCCNPLCYNKATMKFGFKLKAMKIEFGMCEDCQKEIGVAFGYQQV